MRACHGRKTAKASIRDTPDLGMILTKVCRYAVLAKVSWIDLDPHEERNMERNSRNRSLKRKRGGMQGWIAGMVCRDG